MKISLKVIIVQAAQAALLISDAFKLMFVDEMEQDEFELEEDEDMDSNS